LLSGLCIGGLSAWRAVRIRRDHRGRDPWVRHVLGFLQRVVVGVLAAAVAGYVDRAGAFLMSLWWLVFAAVSRFFLHVNYMLSRSETGKDP
jgi:hypothetical protein